MFFFQRKIEHRLIFFKAFKAYFLVEILVWMERSRRELSYEFYFGFFEFWLIYYDFLKFFGKMDFFFSQRPTVSSNEVADAP